MKLFAPALIFCGAAIVGYGQSPQVPHKMQFAGMTLTIRDDARREIQTDVDALTHSPKYFNIKAERAKTYFPIIEAVFAEERLPVDFKFLALQESALVADAVSTSNAVGFWQFKEATALEVGMRVDGSVDERMNIASASRGAARYLKQCNHYFNNWVYALQAYQMGAGGVMRAVGDKNLGTRHMEITSETYWYVKKFLAHKVAFQDVDGKPVIEVVALRNAGGRSISDIAEETSVDEEKLREFNKWLKSGKVPEDKEYTVLVPRGDIAPEFSVLTVASGKAIVLPDKKQAAPVRAEEINGIPVIKALEGETLVALVARANVSMNRFLTWNEMEERKPIIAGEKYFLDKKKKHGTQELYTAQQGEDLWTVSQRFGVRQKSLIKFNKIDQPDASVEGVTLFLTHERPGGEFIVPDSAIAMLDKEESFDWDMTLVPVETQSQGLAQSVAEEVPSDTSSKTVVSEKKEASIHEVRPADTLYSVARQYGVTIREIMEWNDKKDFSLAVGEKLRVGSR